MNNEKVLGFLKETIFDHNPNEKCLLSNASSKLIEKAATYVDEFGEDGVKFIQMFIDVFDTMPNKSYFICAIGQALKDNAVKLNTQNFQNDVYFMSFAVIIQHDPFNLNIINAGDGESHHVILVGDNAEIPKGSNPPVPDIESSTKPAVCHTTGHSILDDLVGANGNWSLSFNYCNYSNNVLLLLPDYCLEDDEKSRNDALISMLDSTFEEMTIIDQFINENPETPFIVREYCFDECVNEMKMRLDKLIVEKDGEKNYDKFYEEFERFKEFLKACLVIYDGPEQYMYDAYYKGWRQFVPKD